MDVSRYIGLMVPGGNQIWPDLRRLANMRVNIDDVNDETVSEGDHEYMSAVGVCLKGWHPLDNRGAHRSPTNGICDMPWVRCYEEDNYQRRLAALVASAPARDQIRTPNLDLVCFEN